MMKLQRIIYVLIVFLSGCQSANLGVACGDIHGEVSGVHLGEEQLANGFPYLMHVYLPPCYELETTRAYPVVFLFPGRSSGSNTWFSAGVDGIADQMILDREIPPLIIVGLQNVGSDLMASNFVENILPYVDTHYRILPGATYHAVAGGSMGGAPSYRLAFRYPNLFDSAALFGSGIITGEEERVREWLAAIPENSRPRVFLNTGFQDGLLLPRAEELAEILNEFDIQPYTIFSEGGHSYDYWVSNFPEYLTWLAQGW